jgi:biopolymer transport protein ExbD
MRYFLFVLIVFAVSCSSAQTKDAQTHIDTAKLFDPYPEPESSYSAQDELMFKNAIALFKPGFTTIYFGKENTFTLEDEVSNYFKKNADSIRQNKFFLIIDSNTKFEKTVSVINLLKKNKIDNYRVINFQEHFAPSATPVAVTPTTITTKPADEDEGLYFSISILNTGFKTKLQNKTTLLKNASELDKFIETNKPAIDSLKIRIIRDKNTPYNQFKPVLDVLKKHEYFKFSLITDPQ